MCSEDGRRRLVSLGTGEAVEVPPALSCVLFETDGLAHASPATLSRCALVHVGAGGGGVAWPLVLSAWLAHMKEDNPHLPFRAADPTDTKGRAARRAAAAVAASATVATPTPGSSQGGGGRLPPTSRMRGVTSHMPAAVSSGEDLRKWTLDAAGVARLTWVFGATLQPCLSFLRSRTTSQTGEPLLPLPPHGPSDAALVSSVLRLLEGAIAQSVAAAGAGDPSARRAYSLGAVQGIPGKACPSLVDLEASAAWAVAWGLGAPLSDAGRATFASFLGGILTHPAAFVEEHEIRAEAIAAGEGRREERAPPLLPARVTASHPLRRPVSLQAGPGGPPTRRRPSATTFSHACRRPKCRGVSSAQPTSLVSASGSSGAPWLCPPPPSAPAAPAPPRLPAAAALRPEPRRPRRARTLLAA